MCARIVGFDKEGEMKKMKSKIDSEKGEDKGQTITNKPSEKSIKRKSKEMID